MYRVDIDNTLCKTNGLRYDKAEPIKAMIKKINKLYKEDALIILETGRQWHDLRLTLKQLKNWGVKYHTLVMGKVPGILIDDMAKRPEEVV